MVSCSGFGLPLHAQLLRLFVTKEGGDALGGIVLGSDVLRYRGSMSVLIIHKTMRCVKLQRDAVVGQHRQSEPRADYALLPCLLLLSSMSACSASLGFKLPVCGNQRKLILEHSMNSL